MPWALAFCSAGTTALGSLAEMTIASCFCVVSVLMYDTCDDAVASDGPTRLNSPLTALTASIPPLSEIVKYGLLICLGRKAIFSPDLICALLSAWPDDELEPPLDELLSFLVEPQAPISSAAASAAVATLNLRVMFLPWWLAVRRPGGAAPAPRSSGRGPTATGGCR